MTQDQSRNSIRNGKTVERIKKLSAVIAEMEENCSHYTALGNCI